MAAEKINFSLYLEKKVKGGQSRTNFSLVELVLLTLFPPSTSHSVSKLKGRE